MHRFCRLGPNWPHSGFGLLCLNTSGFRYARIYGGKATENIAGWVNLKGFLFIGFYGKVIDKGVLGGVIALLKF